MRRAFPRLALPVLLLGCLCVLALPARGATLLLGADTGSFSGAAPGDGPFTLTLDFTASFTGGAFTDSDLATFALTVGGESWALGDIAPSLALGSSLSGTTDAGATTITDLSLINLYNNLDTGTPIPGFEPFSGDENILTVSYSAGGSDGDGWSVVSVFDSTQQLTGANCGSVVVPGVDPPCAAQVPEPGALALVAIGLLAGFGAARRRA